MLKLLVDVTSGERLKPVNFFWVERSGTLRREWQRITAFLDQSQAERFIETVAAGADVWTHLDGTVLPDAFMI